MSMSYRIGTAMRIFDVALVAGLVCVSSVAHAATVREPRSGTRFPSHVSMMSGGATHQLRVTGVALRCKFFVHVYAMAHYMERPPRDAQQAWAQALADATPKQITIEYLRDLTPRQIAVALRQGFRRNTTRQEFAEIHSYVDQMIAYFQDGVERGDRYTIQRSPGGTIVFIFENQEMARLTHRTFARALWAIWLGPQSVVKRARLMAWTARD